MNTSRLVAAAATFGTLLLLFTGAPSRAEETAKIQERLSAEAIVLDPSLTRSRLASAARRLPRREITFETRVGPNTTILTRMPATFAERR